MPGNEVWLDCYGDKWVRWSTVTRVEVVAYHGEYAVVLISDMGAGEARTMWKTAMNRAEGLQAVKELLDRMGR